MQKKKTKTKKNTKRIHDVICRQKGGNEFGSVIDPT